MLRAPTAEPAHPELSAGAVDRAAGPIVVFEPGGDAAADASSLASLQGQTLPAAAVIRVSGDRDAATAVSDAVADLSPGGNPGGNSGVEAAGWITFLCGGVVWAPSRSARLLALADAVPEAAVAQHPVASSADARATPLSWCGDPWARWVALTRRDGAVDVRQGPDATGGLELASGLMVRRRAVAALHETGVLDRLKGVQLSAVASVVAQLALREGLLAALPEALGWTSRVPAPGCCDPERSSERIDARTPWCPHVLWVLDQAAAPNAVRFTQDPSARATRAGEFPPDPRRLAEAPEEEPGATPPARAWPFHRQATLEWLDRIGLEAPLRRWLGRKAV